MFLKFIKNIFKKKSSGVVYIPAWDVNWMRKCAGLGLYGESCEISNNAFFDGIFNTAKTINEQLKNPSEENVQKLSKFEQPPIVSKYSIAVRKKDGTMDTIITTTDSDHIFDATICNN